MDWYPLTEYPTEELWRGTVLRLLVSRWPYETPVDYMLAEARGSPCGLAILVSSGYKAGSLLVQPPVEARSAPDVVAVSRSWLVANWERWVSSACTVQQVLVATRYPPGIGGDVVVASA